LGDCAEKTCFLTVVNTERGGAVTNDFVPTHVILQLLSKNGVSMIRRPSHGGFAAELCAILV
jgi:hypothetical protein